MRKLIFTSFVIGYALVASIVMIPVSILNGLFGLYFHFVSQLVAGMRLFYREVGEQTQKANKPFSWKDYAVERDAANEKAANEKSE